MKIDFRLDFQIEGLSLDDENGSFKFAIKPDPKRYELKEINGKRYLFDKFDKFLIEEEMLFKEMEKQFRGIPLNLQKQEINDIDDYIRERIPEIDTSLNSSNSQSYEFVDKSEEFLNTQVEKTLEFAIVSIDIAGSTKLASSVEHDKYIKIIKTYLDEISRLIPKFHGYILKFTGDGVLAYFPAPSLIRMNDLALDCSLSIRRLVYNCLNPIFLKNNLPQIEIRVGIDSGEASIVELGNSLSKSQKDIIGSVINITTKVQSAGEPNNILLGHSAVKLLHRMYREGIEEFETNPDWPYKTSEKEKYKVFKIKDNAMFNL